MSFTVTISNLPDKELGPLLARLRLPRGTSYATLYKPDVAGLISGPKRSRRPSSTKVCMTGKRPGEGSQLEFGLEAFEKLEAKHGIGTVSLDDLMKNLKLKKRSDKLGRRLLRDGYLEYVE